MDFEGVKSIRKNNNILSSTEIKYRVRIAQESVERTCLSLRATHPFPSPRRFDFFAPRPCFVCPRPAGANSYIRIFADGSSAGWKIGWLCCCPLGLVLLHARAKRKRRKEGASLPSSFLLQNRSEKEKGRKEEKKRRKLVERVGARDIGVCLLRTRPKNRALKAPRLLETLGATFSIGVWREGECGEIMRRGCHECQYFHYFSTRFREACSLLISSSSFIRFSFFPPFFHHSFAISSSPSRKNVFHSSAFFRLIFRGYFSTIENDVKKRPQRNTRNTNRADLAGL